MAWLRGPPARLVQRARGITWLRGPPARLVQRAGGITWVRGPLAAWCGTPTDNGSDYWPAQIPARTRQDTPRPGLGHQ